VDHFLADDKIAVPVLEKGKNSRTTFRTQNVGSDTKSVLAERHAKRIAFLVNDKGGFDRNGGKNLGIPTRANGNNINGKRGEHVFCKKTVVAWPRPKK
jgi:hypothetical protein